jgi:hypothetical protein
MPPEGFGLWTEFGAAAFGSQVEGAEKRYRRKRGEGGRRKPPAGRPVPQEDVPPGLCGVGLVAYTGAVALRLGGMRGLGWWLGRGNGSQTFVRDRRNESSGPVGSGGEG